MKSPDNENYKQPLNEMSLLAMKDNCKWGICTSFNLKTIL